MTNLWVSAGYNFFGYRDADLQGADYTAKGPYVRLRYKFDESLSSPWRRGRQQGGGGRAAMSMRRFLLVAWPFAGWLAAALPAQGQVCAAPGWSGSAASVTGIVNTYFPSAATAFAGSTSVSVGGPDGRGSGTLIAAGDLLLIVQIQDAAITSTNSAAYGGSGGGQGYTTLNSAGLFST